LLEQYLKEPFFYNNQLNEWFDIQRLRNFLVKAIESPRANRELMGYLPFRLLEIKKNMQPYYEKIENVVYSFMK